MICTYPTIEEVEMNALLVKDEALRIEALNQYEVLNSAPDPVLDDLTQLAAQICDTPVAAVSFIGSDPIWIRSRFGIESLQPSLRTPPRETTLPGHNPPPISHPPN